jgi:hypothetical protein
MADTTTQYKVKKGDTLWDIAASFNIPPSQRNTALWKSWGYTGDPRNLPIDFTLNIPMPSAPPASTDTTSATTATTTSATTSTAPTTGDEKKDETEEPDFSASFSYLTQAGKNLADLGKEMATEFPKPPAAGSAEELASPEYKAKEAIEGAIKAETARSREEIADQIRLGEINRARALEQISASPAASRAVIEDFTAKSDNFTNSIARSIERLQADEDNAIAQNDLNYANEIRQEKIDYYNMLQTNLQNSINFTTSAFNMLLSGAQYKQEVSKDEQTQATNYINTMIQAYAGTGTTIDSLSPEASQKLMQQAAVLGLDKNTINRLLTGNEDVQIIHDTETGVVIGIDKNTGQTVFSKLMPGRTGVVTNAQTSAEIVRTLGNAAAKYFAEDATYQKTNGTKISLDSYNKMLNEWKLDDISSLKQFFLAYPLSMIDVPGTTTTAYGQKPPIDNEVYNSIKSIYDSVMKVDSVQALLNAALQNAGLGQ